MARPNFSKEGLFKMLSSDPLFVKFLAEKEKDAKKAVPIVVTQKPEKKEVKKADTFYHGDHSHDKDPEEVSGSSKTTNDEFTDDEWKYMETSPPERESEILNLLKDRVMTGTYQKREICSSLVDPISTKLTKDKILEIKEKIWKNLLKINGLSTEDVELPSFKSGPLKIQFPIIVKKMQQNDVRFLECFMISKVKQIFDDVDKINNLERVEAYMLSLVRGFQMMKTETSVDSIQQIFTSKPNFPEFLNVMSEKINLATILRKFLAKQLKEETLEEKLLQSKKNYMKTKNLLEKSYETFYSDITSLILELGEHNYLTDKIITLISSKITCMSNNIYKYILNNEYLIPKTLVGGIKFYKSQESVLNIVNTHDKYLILYRTPPSSGKTTLAALLPKKIIYCCVVKKVILRLARDARYLGCAPTFVMGRDSKHKIIPQYGIKFEKKKIQMFNEDKFARENLRKEFDAYMQKLNAANAKLYIVDIDSCLWFLKNLEGQFDDFVLFIDEPNMYADLPDHPVTMKIAKILDNLPCRTILSSATLPDITIMKPFVDFWKREHGVDNDDNIFEVSELLLNTSISLFDSNTGNNVAPHNVLDLEKVIEKFDTDIIIQKTYTGSVVVNMMKILDKMGIEYDAPIDFFNIFTFDFKQVRLYAKRLLEIMSTQEITIKEQFKSEVVSTYKSLEIDNLALGFSPYVPGLTMIAVTNPKEFAKQICDSLTSSFSLKGMEKKMKANDKQVKAQEKMKLVMEKTMKKEEREIALSRMEDTVTYHQLVDDEFVIHTNRHLSKYSDSKAYQNFPKRFIRSLPLESDIQKITNLRATEWEQKGLIAGIVHTGAGFDHEYSDLVDSLMEEGKDCPLCIVDESFTYGVNIPASNAILQDDFVELHSKFTIFQYINRVARSSGTHNGKAFMSMSGLNKLFGEDDNIEIQNILKHCPRINTL